MFEGGWGSLNKEQQYLSVEAVKRRKHSKKLCLYYVVSRIPYAPRSPDAAAAAFLEDLQL